MKNETLGRGIMKTRGDAVMAILIKKDYGGKKKKKCKKCKGKCSCPK